MRLDFANKPSFSSYLFYALSFLRVIRTEEYLKAVVINLPLLIVGLFFLLEGLADIFIFRENLREAAGNFLNLFLLVLLPLSLVVLPFYHRNLIISICRALDYEYLQVPDSKQTWLEKIIFWSKYYFFFFIAYTVSSLAFLFTNFVSYAFIYILILIIALISVAAQNYAGILFASILYLLSMVISYALSFSFSSFFLHSISLKKKAYFTDLFSLASRYFSLLLPFYSMEAFFKTYGFIMISIAGILIFNMRIDFFSTEEIKTTEVLTELTQGQQSIIIGIAITLAAALNVFWDILKNIYFTMVWCHHITAAEGVRVQTLIEKANFAS